MRLSLVARLSLAMSAVIALAFASWVVIVDRSTRATFVETQSERRVATREPGPGGVVEREELTITRTPVRTDGAAFAWELWRSAAWWLAAVLMLTVAAIVWVMRRALAPIQRLTVAARQLRHGQDPIPTSESGPPEFTDLARAFEHAAATMAGTERLRRQVIADVGHELLTPVTNLRAQIEALQQGLAPADADALASLEAETRLLQRLVEDFQQLSLADAGRITMHLRVLPLRETLEEILAPIADAAGARWTIEGPGELQVVADEDRLRQVVVNLMDNAARYGPDDLEVDVSVRAVDAQTGSFTFRDNGPGVPVADVPHVFDRFYRGAASPNRTSRGSGLGLAIARGLVDAMGGSIRYEQDDETGGAAFIVTLRRDGSQT